MANLFQYGDITYQDLQLLNRDTMTKLSVDPVTVNQVAAKTQIIPIVSSEFRYICTFFPIVFAPQDKAMPMAIMSFTPKVNPFVDNNHWDPKVYMPLAMQRYPFALSDKTSEGQRILCIDITATTDQPNQYALFDDQGNNSEVLKNSLQRCKQDAEDIEKTEQAVDIIESVGLFTEKQLSITDSQGNERNTSPFKMIDVEKYHQLSDEQIVYLHTNQVTWLIHAHLISLDRLQTIANINQ